MTAAASGLMPTSPSHSLSVMPTQAVTEAESRKWLDTMSQLQYLPESSRTACVAALHGAKVPTTAAATSNPSAPAAKGRTGKAPSAAANSPARTKASRAVAAKGPGKKKASGATAGNGLTVTKASGTGIAKGPIKTKASGATAGSGSVITQASGAVATKGPRKTKVTTGTAGLHHSPSFWVLAVSVAVQFDKHSSTHLCKFLCYAFCLHVRCCSS